STYEDALAGTNAWSFCNYDDVGVGFPRDCGREENKGGQWNSLRQGGKQNIRFSTETKEEYTLHAMPSHSSGAWGI